jgi:nucleoside-diphosphate-sugar epimerase
MFTVLGASGFIGSSLVRRLEAQDVPYLTPSRDQPVLAGPLGHVIYCVGLTADFRQRPFDTVQAHVCRLSSILERGEFESFLYLSTTRLYAGACAGREEESFRVSPEKPDDLYNISKIMGESLCCASGRPRVRIARLSNVYGGDFSSMNFLSSIIRDAVNDGAVSLQTALDSEKDYVALEDVVAMLPRIAADGREQIYNVASGANTTTEAIVEELRRLTGCTVRVAAAAPAFKFPAVSIDRVRKEFGFRPRALLDSLPALVDEYRRWAS